MQEKCLKRSNTMESVHLSQVTWRRFNPRDWLLRSRPHILAQVELIWMHTTKLLNSRLPMELKESLWEERQEKVTSWTGRNILHSLSIPQRSGETTSASLEIQDQIPPERHWLPQRKALELECTELCKLIHTTVNLTKKVCFSISINWWIMDHQLFTTSREGLLKILLQS